MFDLALIASQGAVAATVTETNAATEAHGGAAELHVEPSALGIAPGGWVALAMLILIGIMIWKKVPALAAKALDAKIAGIRQQLDEASALRAEAEALKAEYQQRLAALDGEAAAIRARAEEEAAALVAKTQSDSKDLIARRQRMAEDRIAAAERSAIADVRSRAVQIATAAAASLIAERHDAAADRGLVDTAISGLGRQPN